MATKCYSCGFTENPENAFFCGRCGAKLQIHMDQNSDGTSKIPQTINGGKSENIKTNSENSKLQQTNPKSIGRNDPCPCGSGRKYKNCHGRGIF